MSNLEMYVQAFNDEERAFSPRPRIVSLPLSRAHKKLIRERVENQLSPENLCCDGEASPEYVRKRGNFLRSVLNELEAF
jgi:hypothetical protein